MKRWTIILCGAVVVWAIAAIAAAQMIPNPLALNASPASPSPGQTVRIEASTPTFDRNTAFFEWTVNGARKTDLSGVGKNTISLTAPKKAGAVINVSVTVSQLDGNQSQAALTLPVADLVLTWRAETYIPKWYEGKALPTQASQIKIIAIPNFVSDGDVIPPKNLIYQWTVDDNEPEERALGAQVFALTTSPFPHVTHSIRVSVEDGDKRIRKEGQIFITPLAPKVLIYSASPLGGIEPRTSASTYAAATRGILDFMAEPFFSVTSAGNSRYQWRIDGQLVTGSAENPFLLTIDTSASRLKETVLVSVEISDQNILTPPIIGSFTLKLPPL